ncbi:hypothetical protein [Nocardia crassostreae]|uniref:hypothetical protein n=1 Tax=Nocardia crassostreae TaxID=53428 RepID=UPI0008334DA3|nr:hypothetical protein [Nocardia crassostreae]
MRDWSTPNSTRTLPSEVALSWVCPSSPRVTLSGDTTGALGSDTATAPEDTAICDRSVTSSRV